MTFEDELPARSGRLVLIHVWLRKWENEDWIDFEQNLFDAFDDEQSL